uniref:Dermal papilla derived protein n=1 Tax=Rhipicephalus zambeziensis TaxID=60191 RepID=A0A224YUP4_9ACAR
METFAGHALPGIFFILFGTWWTFAVWRNYVRSRQNKQRYVCHSTYAVPCLPKKFSVEGIVKIIGSCACIAREYPATSGGDRAVYAESLQHQTMYVFYLLNGVVDVMYNAGFPFPPRTDYVALLLASASEGLLFHLHLQGRPHLDVIVHTLLVYSMVAMVTCIVAEMCRPRSVLLSLGRAYFCLLHGTWLWQIGFILHNPLPGYRPWDVNSHMDSMLAASVFAWHLMALLVYVGLLGVLAWVVNRTCGRFCHDFDSVDEEAGDSSESLAKRHM